MRPTKNLDLTVESNITGEEIAMSFDQNSLVHLMSVLTDLYSDPELAVIREYSTNAFDSHIEAGQQRPIEVTLPSPLAPFFRVKDYGVGMSVADIHSTYSKYGASTKRGTDDQVGTLGLGCKSALTYTNQFSLVGVKGGVRCQVAISRDENGSGKMVVVDTCSTDEPDGVEILIPASNRNDFERKAQNFFSFWEPGRVLVNGEPPAPLAGLQICDDIFVHEGESRVVMGNVPYPAKIAVGLPYGYGIIARVPIGSIDFPPARESLHYSSRTNATLSDIATRFRENIDSALQSAVNAAPDMPSALRTDNRWRNVLPKTKRINYRGHPLPDFHDGVVTITAPHSAVLSRHECKTRVSASIWSKSIWFTGYDLTSFSANQKKKLNHWLEELAQLDGWRPDHFILLEGMPPVEWLEERNVADWAEVSAIKLPRAEYSRSGRPTRKRGSFDIWSDGAPIHEVDANDIDTSVALFFRRGSVQQLTAMARLLNHFHPGCTLVCLPGNRLEKFQRDFPEAQSGELEVKRLSDAWHEALSEDDKISLEINDTYALSGLLDCLDADAVDDPELAKAVRLSKGHAIDRLLELRHWFSELHCRRDVSTEWSSPLENYPLADRAALHYHLEDSIIYINAAYAARKDA